MKSDELRKVWDEFRTSKGHTYLPEANVITPAQDGTSLFNTSGMQQLIPYLAGKPHKLGTRLFNIQKCIRTVDIDEVGDRSHLTFFEMMGNWSLGDYFKKEAIAWSWEFLTEHLHIDPRKLAVTIFEGDENAPKDEEAAKQWEATGIPTHKISFMNADNNRRSPGPVGPCGSDTEIFYRVGDKNGGPEFPPVESNVKDDEDNWMEIWNNVFMEFYRDDSGLMTKLNQQNVDTGMGFGRMCCVLQGVDTIFETDLFANLISYIEKTTGMSYADNTRRMRIIADHLRASCLMIDDGAIASNTGAGYILRMVIRRMYYNLVLLKELDDDTVKNFVLEGVHIVAKLNTHRDFNIDRIQENIFKEITSFRKTIANGLKILGEKIGDSSQHTLAGDDAFMLYDTYGFPIELTQEICASQHISLDMDGFQSALEQAKQKSRQASQNMFAKGVDRSTYLEGIPETIFVGYDQMSYDSSTLLKDFLVGEQRILIFDKTPFYAESGGQCGDRGDIALDDGSVVSVKDVKKYEGVFLHFVE